MSIPDTTASEPAVLDVQQPDGRAARRRRSGAVTWRSVYRQPLGIIALAIASILVLVALFAPLLADYPGSYGDSPLQAPSGQHWFGTDSLGRDVLGEVIWGTRQSLLVAFAASAIAIFVGTLLAVTAAYVRRLDGAIGTFVDLMLALPVLPLMIMVAALVGPSTGTIIVVIAAFSWPQVTRVVRSQALTVVTLPYVDAARLMTTSAPWILRKHIVPAAMPVIAVSVVFTTSHAVLAAAGLAFLGLGDPDTWSWGLILYQAQQAGAMASAWWLTMFPSLAILLLVLAATLLSIVYSDAGSPHIRALQAVRQRVPASLRRKDAP